MADSAASTQSRTPRASSTKRRANTVSTETENKLARAAQSAQRLAQLSDASRDDSTLDLFPDDPTRATLEAMNIDIRQGTLHGFELPDVVLAAVGAGGSGDGVAAALSEGKAVRRAPRERSEAPAAVLAGFERLEPTTFSAVAPEGALFASEPAADAPAETLDLAASHEPVTQQCAANAAPMPPAMAAAAVARSVTALRQATGPGADPTASATPTPTPTATIGTTQGASGTLRSGAPFAAPLQEAARTTPELDRVRATAFADTVDALYGVISDQRRAATDHSRRMKWMLSIVVAALLATVAIGVTQTVLLTRLTHETTEQQHRIEEMMQNQQAAMTSLLDAHLATANAVAATPSAASPTPAVAVAPRQTAAGATVTSASKRVTKAHAHPHKPKAMATTH